MRRRHGLQFPLDPHQVGSFIFFAFLASGVYAFYMPFVVVPLRWVLVAIYTALILYVVALGFLTSYADPSDPGLQGGNEGEFYCSICQASVGRTSKHCRACNRCVEGFDHHCKWLNNCVGSKNYRSFFILITVTLTMLLFQFGWGLYLFARSFYDSGTMTAMVSDKYGLQSLHYHGWQVVLALYLLLLGAAVLMLGELVSFHVVLVSKNMTTYDFIMAQRQMTTTESSGSAASGARAALCRSNQIVDVSTAVAVPQRKRNVSLNPCKACTTDKLQGDPRSWDSTATGMAPGSLPGGKFDAAAAAAQPMPENSCRPNIPLGPSGQLGSPAAVSEARDSSQASALAATRAPGQLLQSPRSGPLQQLVPAKAAASAAKVATPAPKPAIPFTTLLAGAAVPVGLDLANSNAALGSGASPSPGSKHLGGRAVGEGPPALSGDRCASGPLPMPLTRPSADVAGVPPDALSQEQAKVCKRSNVRLAPLHIPAASGSGRRQ